MEVASASGAPVVVSVVMKHMDSGPATSTEGSLTRGEAEVVLTGKALVTHNTHVGGGLCVITNVHDIAPSLQSTLVNGRGMVHPSVKGYTIQTDCGMGESLVGTGTHYMRYIHWIAGMYIRMHTYLVDSIERAVR